tara:strand:- start:4 stop:240 length:237 start_codon:yes stop_codon:yes gene_type:complete
MNNIVILYYDVFLDVEVELDIEITSYQPAVKGVYYGDWADSYPDEPAEVEFTISNANYSYLEQAECIYDEVLAKVTEE